MILTVHFLSGAAIASKFQNPILGFLFAFLSHFALDFLPHQEYSFENIAEKRWRKAKFDFLKVFLDLIFGIIFVLFLYLLKDSVSLKQAIAIFMGGFFAILPDGFSLLYFLFPKIKPLKTFYIFHRKIHDFKNPALLKESRVSIFFKILLQPAIAILSILFLL